MSDRLRGLFRLATGRSRLERDLDDELDLHQRLAEDELVGRGVSGEEARRRATAELGDRRALARRLLSIDRARERGERRGERMGKWIADLRLGYRGLRRDPWFSAAALILVALGVGANVAVFGVLNAAFFRALPYPEADQLVSVAETIRGRRVNIAGQNLRDWEREAADVIRLAGYRETAVVLVAGDAPRTVATAAVSRSFPRVMGIDPIVGRWFSEEEARAGAAPVAVLGERLWRDRFGADPAILGSSLRIDGNAVTIVGVMPGALDLPVGTELWIPLEAVDGGNPSRSAHNWRAVGRLRPGVDAEAAARSLGLLTRRLVADLPRSDFLADGAAVLPLRATLLGQSAGALRLLQAAVGLLLLIAVLNLTTLLLARAARRQSEVAMIMTLGAGRVDLIRRFAIESALLTVIGTLIGLGIWIVARGPLLGVLSGLVPFVRALPIDGRFLAFTAATVLVVAVFAGLIPALWVARSVERGVATRDTRKVTGPNRIMRALMGAEVAATFLLLAGAGLLGRSLGEMLDQPLGYQLADRVAVPVSLPGNDGSPYRDFDRRRLFHETVLERFAAVPGVTAVALTSSLPITGFSPNGSGQIQGEPSAAGGPPAVADFRVVSPGYFPVMGIPVVAGRGFEAADGPAAPLVAVVSQAFGRLHLDGADPIGRQVRMPGMDQWSDDGWATVVGVVADTRHGGPGADPAAAIYYDFRQRPQLRTMTVVARVSTAEQGVLREMRGILARLEPGLPFEGVPLASVLREAVAGPRLRTVTLASFASAALVLAGVGLFGVVGFVVLRRTRELGIRIALGASRSRVAGAAVGQALWPLASGLVVGIALALGLGRLVRGFLFGVATADPAAFIGAAALIVVVAVMACIGPIRRALRIDPATALRSD